MDGLTSSSIGLILRRSDVVGGPCVVQDMLPSSAAKACGSLRVGDEVIEVDGVDVRALPPAVVERRFVGPDGEPVTLLVSRPVSRWKQFTVNVERTSNSNEDSADVGLEVVRKADVGLLVRVANLLTPASEAGVKDGDRLASIDQIDVRDWKPNDVSVLLRGPKHTKVSLTLERPHPDSIIFNLTLTRGWAVNVEKQSTDTGAGIDQIEIKKWMEQLSDKVEAVSRQMVSSPGANGTVSSPTGNLGSPPAGLGEEVKVTSAEGQETLLRLRTLEERFASLEATVASRAGGSEKNSKTVEQPLQWNRLPDDTMLRMRRSDLEATIAELRESMAESMEQL